MQNVSENFKIDLVSPSQTLKPILLITDSDDNILYTLTQDKDPLYDTDGNPIRTTNVISKVSNIKTSSDFEQKTLKINRLRCTLYNYYDVNTSLSEKLDTNIVSKNIYLLYKSPSTNVINLTENLNKYDVALIFKGQISRINFDTDVIKLQAEDITQVKIADKQVPYLSVDKLPQEQQDRLLKEYRDDETAVPMTFGSVDRAFVLPYIDENNERQMVIRLDNVRTYNNYKTARIPKLLDVAPNGDYCLYIKKNKDYIIVDHAKATVNRQVDNKSRLILQANYNQSEDFLIPEIQQDTETDFGMWSVTGFGERMVDSVYSGYGSVLDIEDATTDNIEYYNYTGINEINSFNTKKFYRPTDIISSNSQNFDTGMNNYGFSTPAGTGRWILCRMESTFKNDLKNIYTYGDIDGGTSYIIEGNTFLMADYEISQAEYNYLDPTPNQGPQSSALTFVTMGHSGFFVIPIAKDVWKELLNSNDSAHHILNKLLLKTDEDISLAESGDLNLQNYPSDFNNPYRYSAAITLSKYDTKNYRKNFWGTRGANNQIEDSPFHFGNVNGLHYGEEYDFTKPLSVQANEHNYIAIFEYFPESFFLNAGYRQRLKINNFALLHSLHIEDLQEEQIFASITGRKNNYFTEQLEYVEESEEEEFLFNLSQMLQGLNGTKPDTLDIVNNFWDFVNNIRNEIQLNANQLFAGSFNVDIEDLQNNPVFYYYDESTGTNFGRLFTELPLYSNAFDFSFQEIQSLDDSAIWKSNYLWRNIIWRIYTAPLRVFDIVLLDPEQLNIFEDATLGSEVHTKFMKFIDYLNDEFFAKTMAKYIFEYLYQKDMNEQFDYFVYQWYVNNQTTDIINMTQSIQNDMVGKRWNDFNIQTVDDWINNFYVYFDTLIESVSRHLFEGIQTFAMSTEFSEYYYQQNFDIASSNYIDLTGFGYSEVQTNYLHYSLEDMNYIILLQFQLDNTQPTLTDGVIQKPSDIVMNILVNEMGFGKLLDDQVLGVDVIVPDYEKFDMPSIEESRNAHNWKMGLSIGKLTDGKKLIERILKESKSAPRFTSDGKFSLFTISDSYTYEDIDRTIELSDIITYEFDRTKREDIITSVKMFYRYDNGHKRYTFDTYKDIDTILPDYALTGYEYHNVEKEDTFKEIRLKYHTDKLTVEDFAKYTIMNNCNPHNIAKLKLPLNYMDLQVGDKIHIPLINNEKIFDLDYSKVEYLNGQPIYPLWIVTETSISMSSITIKAHQLHYLGTDGNHGFELPEEEYIVRGNTQPLNSTFTFTNGEPIINYNYNSLANEHNNLEIPYFDVTGDGLINVVDIIAVVNHIIGNQPLTAQQKQKLRFRSDGTLKNNNIINVIDIISIINIITQ